MAATCPFCDYTWTPRPTTTGPSLCCPSCQRKFKRPAPVIAVLARKVTLSAECDICGIAVRDLNVCRVDGEAAFICSPCLRGLTE